MNVREAKYDPSASTHVQYSSIDQAAGDSPCREWSGAGWDERGEKGPGRHAYMLLKGASEPLGGNGDSQGDGSSSQAVDPDMDGQPVELDEDLQELVRKKKELQLIEEQIIIKRASIAMKQVAPLLKAMEVEEMKKRKLTEEVKDDLTLQKSPTQSSSTVRPHYVKDGPFKDRVNGILQNCKKHRESPARAPARLAKGTPQQAKALFQPPTMSKSFVERMNATILIKDGCLIKSPPNQKDEEPALKSRVKELMQLRANHGFIPPSNPKVVELQRDRLTQNSEDPDPEQDPATKGFQRFLSILNKGVDIDRLAKIVNDIPGEDGVHGRLQPAESSQESHDGAPPRQGSHDGAPPWDHSCSTSGERTVRTAVDNPSRSASREESPRRSLPGEVKKGVNPEDERKYGEMHDLLQTIGLDLGLDEVGQLSDRIQERLYGRNGHTATKRGAREDERKRKRGENQRERERSPRKASRDGFQVRPAVSDSVSRDKHRDSLETSIGQSIPTLTRTCPSQLTPSPAPVDMTSAYIPPPRPQYLTQHLNPHPNTIPPSWGATPRPDVYSLSSASYPQPPPNPLDYFDSSPAVFNQTQVCYPPPGHLPPPDTGFPGPSQAHWTGTQ